MSSAKCALFCLLLKTAQFQQATSCRSINLILAMSLVFFDLYSFANLEVCKEIFVIIQSALFLCRCNVLACGTDGVRCGYCHLNWIGKQLPKYATLNACGCLTLLWPWNVSTVTVMLWTSKAKWVVTLRTARLLWHLNHHHHLIIYPLTTKVAGAL